MTYEKNIIPYDDIKKRFRIIDWTLGVDVGSADFTVFTLVGFTSGYREAIIVDKLEINHVGTTKMWRAFEEWWKEYSNLAVHGMFFDYGQHNGLLYLYLFTRGVHTNIQNVCANGETLLLS
jgi:hypothetical protein